LIISEWFFAANDPYERRNIMSDREKRVMRIVLQVPNQKTLTKMVQEYRLDIGGGGPRRLPDGSLRTQAYVPEELLVKIRKAGGTIEVMEDATQVGRERQKEVGRGDRFKGGKKVPRGLGRKE